MFKFKQRAQVLLFSCGNSIVRAQRLQAFATIHTSQALPQIP